MGWIGGFIERWETLDEVYDSWNNTLGEIPSRMADTNSIVNVGTFSTRKAAEEELRGRVNRRDIIGCGFAKVVEKAAIPSKTMNALKARIEREEKKLADYFAKHNAKFRKSAFVGCKECDSSINKRYIGEKNICPVCGASFFSQTDTDTMNGYKANIKRWKADYAAMKKKRAPQEKAYYLMLVEAYCG